MDMAKKPVTVEELADYALITDVTSYSNELAGTPAATAAELAEKVLLTDVTYFDDSSEVESSTENTEGTTVDTPSTENTTADDAPVDTPSTENTPADGASGDSKI